MKKTITYIIAVIMTAFSASAQVLDQNGQVVDTTAIYGERADSLDAAVFTSRQAGNYLSKMKEVRTEVISAAGLCKMACCNLAESFENSAGVTVGYYDAVTVGIDFTARDLQSDFRGKGLPWELCKGFDDSAVLGKFVPVGSLPPIQDLHFHLDIDGQTVQRGHTADMLFKVDEIIAYVSQFCTLKIGDLLYTGTPVGVGPVSVGQHLQGYLEGEKLLDFHVR